MSTPEQQPEEPTPKTRKAILIEVLPKKRKKKKPQKDPRFHVVLWNDDVHTFQYVVHMLQSIFGYVPERGWQIAKEVHLSGRAIVFTSSLGESELKRDQILAFVPDPSIDESDGPLCATLERDRNE